MWGDASAAGGRRSCDQGDQRPGGEEGPERQLAGSGGAAEAEKQQEAKPGRERKREEQRDRAAAVESEHDQEREFNVAHSQRLRTEEAEREQCAHESESLNEREERDPARGPSRRAGSSGR